MAETLNVLKRFSSFDISPEQNVYDGVIIHTGLQTDDGEDIDYVAGNQDGNNVLTIKNEWGTQEQANAIFADLQNAKFRYRPYTATDAHIDPAAELGDGVNISDVYSGIYAKATTFGKLMTSDISAPSGEEIKHEFNTVEPTQRQYTRFTKQVRSQLVITATQIAAEVEERRKQGEELRSSIVQTASAIRAEVVSKSSDNGRNTFGWNLTANDWNVYSGSTSNSVLRVSPSGLEVAGTIRAGHIGGTSGFVITATSIYNNKPSLWSSQSNGVYIGTDGIALGNNFRVDSGGNLTANSASLGSLTVNGSMITGSIGALSYDGYSTSYGGSLNYCGGSVSGLSGSLSTGINVGNKGIETYVGDIVANKISANYIESKVASLGSIRVGWERFGPGTIYYMNRNGGVSRMRVLLTQDN